MNYDLIISVVLYHNSEAQINKLINSCSHPELRLRLIFIDNDPGHAPELAQRQWPPQVEYRPQSENIGYGSAHNKAILDNKLAAPYHLILNPDVYFDPAVLPKLIGYMAQRPECGLLMPLVTYPDGEDQGLRKLLPTPFDLFARRFIPRFLRGLFKSSLADYELRQFSASREMEVPVLSGCFMFCRRPWLQEIGGFDERFFLYLEDVDLSRRLLHKGKNLFWPGVQVIHEYQKDSYKSGSQLKRHLRSAWQYFNKYGWFFDRERKRINDQALTQKSGAQAK